MTRKLKFAGFVFASLTIATVALAQQGGGRGGEGGSGDAGGSDNSVISLRLFDHEKARLTRGVAPRRAGADCLTHVCNEPPNRRPPTRTELANTDNCGGDNRVAYDRSGRQIRRICQTF